MLRHDFLNTLRFPAELAQEYFDWNYETRKLLEDIRFVCQSGQEGPWLPEDIEGRLNKALDFWENKD